MLERYRRLIANISTKINDIAEICIVISMVMIVLNIFLRIFFNKPMSGLVDYVGLLAAPIVGFALALAAVKEAHLEVDFILSYFPKAIQKAAYLVVNVLTFVFLFVLTVYSFLYAQNMLTRNEVTMTSRTPIFPFALSVAVGMTAYTLVVFGKMLKVMSNIKNGRDVFEK